MPADTDFQTELLKLIPHMRAFARSLCGDRELGDDIAQDALERALKSAASFTPGTNMKAWTFMIVRNLFYSHTRRSWRSCALDPEVAERSLVAVCNPTAQLELDELRRALKKLPDSQREALILVGACGFSYEDVAEMAGVAIGTIKSRVSRARDQLAAVMESGDFDEDGVSSDRAMDLILNQVASLRAAA